MIKFNSQFPSFRTFYLFFLFGISMHLVSGQSNVTGKVTDNAGVALPGANVTVKGTQKGVVTDFDGVYTISVNDNETLIFSYVGYKAQELNVNGRSEINVTLNSSDEELDQVVVMAYGTQKKRDVTGSISKVTASDLSSGAMPGGSAAQGLQGQASGLQVVSSSGLPGAGVQIKVRGLSSISSGTNPLYVVDGIVGLGINSVNPNDIASIEILKDASATAIYGARGSNGVVIITTKQATSGEPQFNVSIKAGISDWTNTDVGNADTSTYFQIMDAAIQNTSIAGGVDLGNFDTDYINQNILSSLYDRYGFSPITSRADIENINTDFNDLLSQTGSFQDVSISTSKKTENSSSYASVWYRNDEGNLKNTDFNQLAARLNLTYNKGNLIYGVRMFGNTTERNQVSNWGNKVPWWQVYDPDNASGYWNGQTGANPLANQDGNLNKNFTKSIGLSASIFAELEINAIKGLKVRAEYSPTINETHQTIWKSETINTNINGGNTGAETKNSGKSTVYNFYGTFDRDFDKHNINLVAGAERQKGSLHRTLVAGNNLLGDYQEVYIPTTEVQAESFLDFLNETKRISYFSRLNYKFDDKYLLGASFTREGYSQFSPELRWGNFYSLSAGWIISDDLFKDSDVVSLLKLRGSYGQTGNGNVPGGITETSISVNTSTRLYVNQPTQNVSSLGNSDTTWEKLNNLDVGFDYGFLNNRINGSIAYYRQEVEDLLLELALPLSAGIGNTNGDTTTSSIWANIGDMYNHGIEFDINAAIIDKGDFQWNANFNFTTNNNEVTSIAPSIDAAGSGILNTYTITKKGLPLGTYFLASYAGVDPQTGVPLIHEVDLDLQAQGIYEFTGNTIPATQGLAATHKVALGNKSALPTYFGGFNNTFRYKNLDLSMNIYFSGGNYIFNRYRMFAERPLSGGQALSADILANSWQQPGDNAKYPQLILNSQFFYDEDLNPSGPNTYIGNNGLVDEYLEKGDFIRLKTLTLGYTLPESVIKKAFLTSARVYMSATNLITITDYKGYDPELTLSGGSNIQGTLFSGGGLPQSKIVSLGLDVTF